MSRRVHNEARRIPLDAYYSSDDVAALCVSTLDLSGATRIVEPSVGGGAFVRAIRTVWPGWVYGVDINHDAPGLDLCPSQMRGWDFLDVGKSGDFLDLPNGADWVIGNPPYSHAEPHVRHALTLAPRCAFLLRLAFLESTKRVAFWRDHQPARVYVLAQRPSFTGGGTDSAAYGWFVWDADHKGATELHVLDESGPLWGGK